MVFTKTYQVADSSAFNNSFGAKEQEEPNGMELIEEVDEPINIPKPKKYYKTKPDSGVQAIDTFYGIKNESGIPVWNISAKKFSKETSLEVLFEPTPLVETIMGWQTVVLIGSILLLGMAKAFSKNRFKQAIKALFNNAVSQEIVREEKVFFHRSNVLFTIIHLLSTSLFLYHIKEIINVSPGNNFLFFLLIVGFLVVVYIIKYIFSQVLFYILNDTHTASEYIFNVSLYNNLLGVVLIPILCVTYFSSLDFNIIFTYIASPLILLIFILRLIRLYAIGISKGISYFYIFLYICTLEILPLVVLFRIFIFN